MTDKLRKNFQLFIFVIFAALTVWWILLASGHNTNNDAAYNFGASYGIIALLGGVYGLFSAKQWGGMKSKIGQAIILLSAGLLLAEFGQIVFSYYNIVSKVEVPYPSLADVGFFGSIPLYIGGALALISGLSATKILKSHPVKLIIGITVPLVILGVSFGLFLKDYTFSGTSTLTAFLDFGYPIGQAIYVSLALVCLLSVAGVLGGALKNPIIFLLTAFFAQYVADFNFLYQNYHGTWANGGYGDYLYLLAYFLMTLSLIRISGSVLSKKTVSAVEKIES